MTDLSMYRGDTGSWLVTFKDKTGTALDITNYIVFFTVKSKNSYTDDTADTDAIIAKTITVHTDPIHGQSTITVLPADTATAAPKIYVYDMQLKTSSGQILTFMSGDFEIIADVTRRTS